MSDQFQAQTPEQSFDQMDQPEEITLVFRFLPSDRPWNIRLRQLLKFALRSCQMREINRKDGE